MYPKDLSVLVEKLDEADRSGKSWDKARKSDKQFDQPENRLKVINLQNLYF